MNAVAVINRTSGIRKLATYTSSNSLAPKKCANVRSRKNDNTYPNTLTPPNMKAMVCTLVCDLFNNFRIGKQIVVYHPLQKQKPHDICKTWWLLRSWGYRLWTLCNFSRYFSYFFSVLFIEFKYDLYPSFSSAFSSWLYS